MAMRIWEAVGVGVIVIINQPLVWFLEIRKKQEPKFCIEWKCFLIILTCNGWIMENNIQRSHSQPRKRKKSSIVCKNWENSSQSAAGGRNFFFQFLFFFSFFFEFEKNPTSCWYIITMSPSSNHPFDHNGASWNLDAGYLWKKDVVHK